MIEPTWQQGDVALYLGDCLEILPQLEAGSVDAVITDPPYNVGIDYGELTNDNMSLDEYGEWLKPRIGAAQTTTKEGGLLFWWMAMRHCHCWHKWFPDGWRIFAALKNFVQYRPTPIQYSFDPVIFWSNGKSDRPGIAGMRDWHIGNTARWVCEKSNGHPVPRPLDTVRYVNELSTDLGALILDPFMGSGTTGVACVQTGRRFIGIEIDPKYFDIAVKRISQAQLQMRMPI